MKKLFSVLFMVLVASAAWAQGNTAIDELKTDPRKAYGTDYPYQFANPQLTKAPKGYKPFYISHYGRHGSRYYWNAMLYQELANLLKVAHERGQLTKEGEAFFEKFMAAKEELQTGVLINPIIMPKQEWGRHVSPFYLNYFCSPPARLLSEAAWH